MSLPIVFSPYSETISTIVTGLYSSGIFLITLSLLKPRLRICNKLAYHYNPSLPIGKQHHYSFKIVNKSILFSVYDIQLRAWISKTEPSPNADDISFQKIHITKDYQWVLNRMYIGHLCQDIFLRHKRLENRTDYAAQFSTNDDLKKMIADGHYITIEIISKHALTGFTKVNSKKYKHINDISEGHYFSGNSCRICP
jgi:hypothetical protein